MNEEWLVYPEQFGVAMSALIPGSCSVTSYEFDEDWNAIEILRDGIDVPGIKAP